jgi:low temperature requirement protein LtrA
VTPLELFFDLVLVFAITQVTGYISAEPTWTRLVEGLAILAVLWWAWVSFAWLANSRASDEGLVRVVLLAAMGALLIVSLAVPQAFGDDALIFGVAYMVVRLLHIGAYVAVSRDDPELRGVVVRLASTVVPATSLLVLAGLLDGTPRALCWIAALTIDYGGLALRGVEGWRVEPGHFAERHGLIVIIAIGESIVAIGVGAGTEVDAGVVAAATLGIALGESIVALGVGANGLELDAGIITAALLGIAVAGALWWAYFDVVAIAGERRFRAAGHAAQVRMARDSYTYLHMPMVAGIVIFAVGVKKTLGHVGDPLHDVPAVALCGGVALYLLALSAFKRRNVGSWNRPRLVVATVLAALIPAALELPALASLAIVAALSCALIAYEATAYADARARIRHAST